MTKFTSAYLNNDYPIPSELVADYPETTEIKAAVQQAIIEGQKLAVEMGKCGEWQKVHEMMGVNSDYKKEKEGKHD